MNGIGLAIRTDLSPAELRTHARQEPDRGGRVHDGDRHALAGMTRAEAARLTGV